MDDGEGLVLNDCHYNAEEVNFI